MSKLKINLNDWHDQAQHEDPVDIAGNDLQDAAEYLSVMLEDEKHPQLSPFDVMRKHPELVGALAKTHAINRFEHTYRTLKIEELRLLAAANGRTLCDESIDVEQLLADTCISVQDIFNAAIEAFHFLMTGRKGSSDSATREDWTAFAKANPDLFAGFYKVFFDEYHRQHSDDAAFYQSQGHINGESQKGRNNE